MFIINWIVKALKALNSNQNPIGVALGISFGVFLGIMPSDNLLWFIVLILTFFIDLNMAIQFVFLGIFKLFNFVFDNLIHNIGYFILTQEKLSPFFTELANTPVIPLTRFNNSMVMGGFVFGLILFVPLTIILVLLIKYYRNTLREKIVNSKIVKWFMASPMVTGIVGLFKPIFGIFGKFQK